MKNLFSILLFLSVVGSVAGQDRDTVIYYDSYWRPCKFRIASYYREVTLDKNGIPVGTIKDYYISGELQWEGKAFHNDPSDPTGLDGKCVWYYKNGAILKIETYKNKVLNGKYEKFTKEGYLDEEGFYLRGEKHGEFKEYYKPGTIYSLTNYKNGKRDGYSYLYYNQGGVIKSQFCVNDRLEDSVITYYVSGEIEEIQYFKNGYQYGNAITFYPDGNIKVIKKYNNNILLSETHYFNNGDFDKKTTITNTDTS